MTEERIEEIKQIVHYMYETTESPGVLFLCPIIDELIEYIESIT